MQLPIKVLHAGHHYAPCTGGVERVVQSLCEGCRETGVESSVVCLNRCASGGLLPWRDRINEIPVRRIPFIDLKYYKVAPALFLHLYGGRNKIVHLHTMGFFLDFAVLTGFLHRKHIVMSMHGGVFHTEKHSWLKKLYFYGLLGLFLRNVTVIAHSRNDYGLAKRVKKDVVFIPHSIDCSRFTAPASRQGKTVLFVGRVFRSKRIDLLIKAFASALKEHPDAKLVMVGEDWGERASLEALCKELGCGKRVEFAGSITDKELVKRMQQAAVFASASPYEGFGLSAVEAMACGCIPVVQNNESFRNFVEHGKSGFLVDYENTAKAADVIAKALSAAVEQPSKMSAAAQKKAREFCWAENAKKYAAVYSALLKGRKLQVMVPQETKK